jgi:hypothetical protein
MTLLANPFFGRLLLLYIDLTECDRKGHIESFYGKNNAVFYYAM